jgi:hypothetical protein
MIKPIVQETLLKGWSVDPFTYFGSYHKKVAIEIDPVCDPYWISDNTIFRVAVQAEPPSVNNSGPENYLISNGHKYDLVLTYYESILSVLSNSSFNYFAGTWISDIKNDFNKNKLVSFITSNKNFATGHKVRIEVVNNLSHKFDLYGRGFNEISNKIIGLENYRYSVVIENEFMKNWFTEKIIDCFMTKTIPIYKGCPNIGDFYDTNGIIVFDNIEELSDILDSLDDEKYESMRHSIELNYNKAINDLPFNERIELLIKERLK